MSATAATVAAQDALNHTLSCVAAEFKDMTDGSEMIAKISKRFKDAYREPPTKDFEFVLQKAFTDDEVRVALFKPKEEQIDHYVKLLTAISQLPAAHPLSKLLSLLISLIFLVHR